MIANLPFHNAIYLVMIMVIYCAGCSCFMRMFPVNPSRAHPPLPLSLIFTGISANISVTLSAIFFPKFKSAI
jgi:hypothetical protein